MPLVTASGLLDSSEMLAIISAYAISLGTFKQPSDSIRVSKR
jgi:hypothetical protein